VGRDLYRRHATRGRAGRSDRRVGLGLVLSAALIGQSLALVLHLPVSAQPVESEPSVEVSAVYPGGPLQVEWDASAGASGYRVYWGTAPRTYSGSANVAQQQYFVFRSATNSQGMFTDVGVRFYFAVTALGDGSGSTPTLTPPGSTRVIRGAL
jgi:hypothetical protein